jgi:uncharacterized membrane protein YeiH
VVFALLETGFRPPLLLELVAVFLGGVSGSLFAVQRQLPINGELVLGVAAGLGGGMIRDILLGRTPVALTNEWYLWVAVAGALVSFAFGSLIGTRVQRVLDVLDPAWMGLFAVLGADAALRHHTTPIGAVLVGCATAVGGGVLRDVLAGDTPQLVLPGPINYLAGIAGAVVYTGLVTSTDVSAIAAAWGTLVLVVGLRLAAMRFGILAPPPLDLPGAVRRGRSFRRHQRPE